MDRLHIVWFRRDLRVHDHAPLHAAAASGGRVLALYVVEPDYWALPEHSGRQFEFLLECLDSLDEVLRARGGGLTVRTGHARDVLAALHARHGIEAIYTHPDSGLDWCRERDQLVRRWATRAGVGFHEFPRDGMAGAHLPAADWTAQWQARMAAPRFPAPDRIRHADIGRGHWPDAAALGLPADPCPGRQTGGRAAAIELLNTLLRRGTPAGSDPSLSVAAADPGSGLSPHLAFGTLSTREAVLAAHAAMNRGSEAGDRAAAAGLDRFIAGLEQRCRAILSFADAAGAGWDGLHTPDRGPDPATREDERLLRAWQDGRTGFPFVDACMRALHETGWLNDRMRALLVAFASYHLWLDRGRIARWLARLFTDFEPGIHYPQVKSHSAAGQANAARICNPVRQSMEQDPDGTFIRRHVPELAGLPAPALHAPWAHGVNVEALGYPSRIVDHEVAARQARERIRALGHPTASRPAAAGADTRHAPPGAGKRTRGQPPPAAGRRSGGQLSLPFGERQAS